MYDHSSDRRMARAWDEGRRRGQRVSVSKAIPTYEAWRLGFEYVIDIEQCIEQGGRATSTRIGNGG